MLDGLAVGELDNEQSRERMLAFAGRVAAQIGVPSEQLVTAFIDALDEDAQLEVDVVGVAVRHAIARLEHH